MTRPAVLVLDDGVSAETIPVLCAHLRALLRDPAVGIVTCDVSGVVEPDLVTVEALARLALTARRAGGAVHLHHAGPGLRALLALAGLTDVVGARSRPAGDPPDP